jgi:hypothetical protein
MNAVLTNSQLYRDIAIESWRQSQVALDAHRQPKSEGSGGYVSRRDPTFASFKQAMIAIVFAGMYLEARLWVVGSARVGTVAYKTTDKKALEERVTHLGITDSALIADLKEYREARKDLVHEKTPHFVGAEEDGFLVSTQPVSIVAAQDLARRAVDLKCRVDDALSR